MRRSTIACGSNPSQVSDDVAKCGFVNRTPFVPLRVVILVGLLNRFHGGFGVVAEKSANGTVLDMDVVTCASKLFAPTEYGPWFDFVDCCLDLLQVVTVTPPTFGTAAVVDAINFRADIKDEAWIALLWTDVKLTRAAKTMPDSEGAIMLLEIEIDRSVRQNEMLRLLVVYTETEFSINEVKEWKRLTD